MMRFHTVLNFFRPEASLHYWFEQNYRQLGYDRVVRSDHGRTPDFIMERDGHQIKVEIEIRSSGFYRHSTEDVDEVVCIKKDVDIPVKVIVVYGVIYVKNIFEFREINRAIERQGYIDLPDNYLDDSFLRGLLVYDDTDRQSEGAIV